MKSANLVSIKNLMLIFLLLYSNALIAQTIVLSDDFESGTSNWTLTGVWGLSTAQYNSKANSLTESPTGNYTNMHSSAATTKNAIDLSSYLSAEISFWAKYNIEYAFDYMYLEVSKDGGSTYVTLAEFTGVSSTMKKYTYSIGSFAGFSNIKVRFRFYSDQYIVGDGMYIDDIVVSGSVIDNSPPLIVHISPKFYEGTLGAFTVNADISDVSGIAETKLYYNVDGGLSNVINGEHITGNQYYFIIPAQPAGSHVTYKIGATDNADPANTTDTSIVKSHRYIAGTYLKYDNGIVNAVSTISGVNGAAVKITIPSGQYGFIRSALIRNYKDVNNTNADMLFHVWANDNGLPGIDLITPFLVTPEATLDNPFPFTRIDLRSYSPELDDMQGDVFIGFTVPINSVSIITSDVSSGRSFNFNGTSWTAASKDYEFRVIINESSTPLPVELTTFTAKVNESIVSLNWSTATEVNNYGFEIERKNITEVSNNAGNKEWQNIAFVQGYGNSNSTKYYSFQDNEKSINGKYLYRLKQIDIDGKFEYSDIIEVEISAPDKFSLNQNYPNPFNPTTTIKYSVPLLENRQTVPVQLKVYDILGKELKTLVNDNLNSGIYEVQFNASEFPSGLYFYTISAGNYTQTKKMMLMK